MTLIETAKAGKISRAMRSVARSENVSPDFIRRGVSNGTIVIPRNKLRRGPKPCGIGAGLRTKINANVGTSKDMPHPAAEIKKMKEAVRFGADTVMDLSTGGDLGDVRRRILRLSGVPVGTVPVYEIAVIGMKNRGSISDITADDMFDVIEAQAKDGVDFFTIHAGVVRKALEKLKESPRILDIVSRGGAFLAEWMIVNNRENPFYEYFDRVLDIARRYDVTLSLGDGLRPGSVADATDAPQITELIVLGELQKKALRSGVQVIIEGPGHVPINQIETNVVLEKSICGDAPFYVLGPLVTDVGAGYDHITAAIGGALAAARGADFLCYVTPSEHLRLPTIEDVREGVVASKIAAHAADIAKGIKGAMDWDIRISMARRERNWSKQFKFSIDPEKPKKYRKASRPDVKDVCTMCSDYCSIKTAERCLKVLRSRPGR